MNGTTTTRRAHRLNRQRALNQLGRDAYPVNGDIPQWRAIALLIAQAHAGNRYQPLRDPRRSPATHHPPVKGK